MGFLIDMTWYQYRIGAVTLTLGFNHSPNMLIVPIVLVFIVFIGLYM